MIKKTKIALISTATAIVATGTILTLAVTLSKGNAEDATEIEASTVAVVKMEDPTTEVIKETESTTVEETTTEAPTEVKTEAPTEAKTEAKTEIKTEAPTKVKTEAPTKAKVEVKTEAPTKAKTEAPTKAKTEATTKAKAEVKTEAPKTPEYPWRSIDVSVPGVYSGVTDGFVWRVEVIPGCLDCIEYFNNVILLLNPEGTTTYHSPFGTIIEGGYSYVQTRSGMNMALLVGETGTAFFMRGVYSTNTTVLHEGTSDINNEAAIAAESDFNCWYMGGVLK